MRQVLTFDLRADPSFPEYFREDRSGPSCPKNVLAGKPGSDPIGGEALQDCSELTRLAASSALGVL